MNTNPIFPDSKKAHDINEQQAGREGSQGSAPLEVTRESGVDGLEFGTFVSKLANGKLKKVIAADTEVAGIALGSHLATDYANRKYNTDNKVALARRDFFTVKIDIANKPVAGGPVRISSAAGIEGYLTTDLTDSKLVAEGVEIEAVYDTIAEVYLEGKASIALT